MSSFFFFFTPSAPLVHFFSFFNQSSRLRPDPPSPGLSLSSSLLPPLVFPPPSLIDVRFSLLVSLSLIQESMETYSRSSASRLAGVRWCLSAALFGSVLGRNPFAVVSLPVDSYVCDSFCTPFLGTFRDCAFRTFPRIVVNCYPASCYESYTTKGNANWSRVSRCVFFLPRALGWDLGRLNWRRGKLDWNSVWILLKIVWTSFKQSERSILKNSEHCLPRVCPATLFFFSHSIHVCRPEDGRCLTEFIVHIEE